MMVTSSPNKSILIETTMKISDLPVNLVEEILSKVPLKYMRAVRSTCKQWDTLSKSRSFSKMHADKIRSDEFMMMIAMIDYNLYLVKVVVIVNEDPIVEIKGKLTCQDIQSKISRVFHCDGLLLCVLKDDATKVIVWNPYWGQTRSIEFRYSSHRPYGWDMFTYALGYEDNSSCRSYKLLRFIDHKYYSAPIDQFSWYEIYDFESSTWKTLDVTPYWRILCCQCGASLKGNTYWPASQRRSTDDDVLDDHIICFDYKSESFGPLLRLPFDAGRDDYVTLSCVREEKLAVLLSHNEAGPLELDIWITTKIEADKVSWSKFLRVETKTGALALVNCDSFFIDEEMKVAMGYRNTFNIVGEFGYLKKLELVERAGTNLEYCRADVCSYVPSLVQIKQPAAGGGGKRKRQSYLEKQRYDQNMSRLAAIEKRRSV
ncbi:F-box protein [Raphanus sativus]|uniref:F-box protein At2g38590-like n=1 Tax=Raphanus sativus TaxID=3726 RepID=A0A6J0NTG0_RAPSA|nr:F-box protein At2g38590-like [Raphanus sativus]KAJ4916778.1 F-box protein [Raphanus sativus]